MVTRNDVVFVVNVAVVVFAVKVAVVKGVAGLVDGLVVLVVLVLVDPADDDDRLDMTS